MLRAEQTLVTVHLPLEALGELDRLLQGAGRIGRHHPAIARDLAGRHLDGWQRRSYLEWIGAMQTAIRAQVRHHRPAPDRPGPAYRRLRPLRPAR